MYPIGETKLIIRESLTTHCAVRPPEGWEWIIIWGGLYHDDTVARLVYIRWNYSDDDDNIITTFNTDAANINPNIYLPVNSLRVGTTDSNQGGFLKLTHNLWFEWSVNAMAANKKGIVNLIVIERPENLELSIAQMFGNYMGYKLPIRSRE